MSSNAAPAVPGFRKVMPMLAVIAALWLGAPLRAQDDTAATPPAAATPESAPRPRVNVLVTIPRGEVNEAQARECADQADANTISGEIIVCRDIGDDGSNSFSGDRLKAQKRYAQETAFANSPQAPDVAGAGIFKGPATISGKCLIPPCPPPQAVFIDVEALPTAPAGSDADRIARGLPPLGRYGELTEEEEKARREALGIKTAAPPRPKK